MAILQGADRTDRRQIGTVQAVPDAVAVRRDVGDPADLRDRVMRAHADFGSLVAELDLGDERWTTVRPVVLAIAERARMVAAMLRGGHGEPSTGSTYRSAWRSGLTGGVVPPVVVLRDLAGAG